MGAINAVKSLIVDAPKWQSFYKARTLLRSKNITPHTFTVGIQGFRNAAGAVVSAQHGVSIL